MVYRLCFASLTWFFKVSLLAKTRITLAKMKTWNVFLFQSCETDGGQINASAIWCILQRGKTGSGSVGGFSSVCSARGRDLFSALVLVLSAVLAKVNLSLVLFYITSRSEKVFCGVKRESSPWLHDNLVYFMCNNIWKPVKDDHLACVLLFFFTHFQLWSEVQRSAYPFSSS